MYFPFIRGKQFELVAIRELAPKLPNYLFKPIVEPVRENLLPLVKTIKSINEFNIKPIIIINPSLGDFKSKNINLYPRLLSLDNSLNFTPCIQIQDGIVDYSIILQELPKNDKAIFVPDIVEDVNPAIFSLSNFNIVPADSSDSEIEKINNIVLLDDPFQKKSRNADYRDRSKFSSLHTNYSFRPNTIGFSDYNIVGSEYSESGGPAYVVTIHLSYIDKESQQMFVRHFSSSPSNSPANPGGKFEEALNNAIHFIDKNPSIFDDTFGIEELRRLHITEHFPGLGLVKKITVQHHIETICNYLKK
ncbi:sce7725 family protein [Rahnella sp. SAP-1]|uniref:Sce7725 family protein n=1 Tax=Rouxiella aceris TaxID=2703884 RepID=A0A848MKS1_9GAMM|nr:sce7725 family protein [Rouxiella aceris]NMP29128.1 sce7725 family protein [Rouxiella aceris]